MAFFLKIWKILFVDTEPDVPVIELFYLPLKGVTSES